MTPSDFDWDDANLDHIAEHDVEPWEVEEVFGDSDRQPAPAYSTPSERRRAIVGMGYGGRILYVVYTVRRGLIRVVTAREAEERFRRLYRRRRR